MPRGREFLERFRPAGTPGAASAAGVPADRVAELSAELAPVFAALAETEKEAAALLAGAQAEAARRTQRAREQARAIEVAARRQADADRAEAVARARRASDAATTTTLDAARREAAAIRSWAEQRLLRFLERVQTAMRSAAAQPPP